MASTSKVQVQEACMSSTWQTVQLHNLLGQLFQLRDLGKLLVVVARGPGLILSNGCMSLEKLSDSADILLWIKPRRRCQHRRTTHGTVPVLKLQARVACV